MPPGLQKTAGGDVDWEIKKNTSINSSGELEKKEQKEKI